MTSQNRRFLVEFGLKSKPRVDFFFEQMPNFMVKSLEFLGDHPVEEATC